MNLMGTTLYLDNKVARVVFKFDTKKRVYWIDVTSLTVDHIQSLKISYYRDYYIPNSKKPRYLNFIHELRNLDFAVNFLPIEQWLKQQNMYKVEEDMTLFALTWG